VGKEEVATEKVTRQRRYRAELVVRAEPLATFLVGADLTDNRRSGDPQQRRSESLDHPDENDVDRVVDEDEATEDDEIQDEPGQQVPFRVADVDAPT